MARRTAALKPQLNQIRTWAREGRTNAWIAYQLGTTSQTVHDFRHEFGLDKAPGAPVQEPVTPELVVQQIAFDSPPPLPPLDEAPAAEAAEAEAPAKPRRARRSRAAKVEAEAPQAEVEAVAEGPAEEAAEGEPERARRPRRRRGSRGGGAGAAAETAAETPVEEPAEPAEEPAAKQPRRRGGRGTPAYTGSIVSGAVLVLDPAIVRSAAWRANWADTPAFDVQIEDDQIVLRRRSKA